MKAKIENEFDLNKIRVLAKQHNITLKAFAEKIKINYVALMHLLRKNTASVKTLKSIADYFGVPLDYFFKEKEITDENSVLNFYLNMRTQLIQRLWNCPPAYHEGMTYCITELYKTQNKINELITSKTQENGKTE